MTLETFSLKTTINELVFLRKITIIQGNTWKKTFFFLVANKLIEKIPDPRNAKEHNKSFMRKENTKSVK